MGVLNVITTAVLSAAGVYLGRQFGVSIGRKLDVFGGAANEGRR